jgi:ribosome-associated toxin RatA of RatAB toxin-antitoxin module
MNRLTAIIAVCVPLLWTHAAVASGPPPTPDVSVREARGTYTVTARFEVPQTAGVARAVLSDYEHIPRFMPDVRTSIVSERTPGRLLVEQEAVSQFMMFSKTVHLRLEVTEDAETIRFVDRCGKSFVRYEGLWRLTPVAGGTIITYELTASPSFEVPGFILRRLLTRGSNIMIGHLRREIAARAVTP